jgi:dynein intermediate chain 2, axonemal
METTYVYQKERREFGRQCLFSDKNELLFSEATNRDLSKEFINRNPVSTGTQLGRQMAASEVNF